MSKNKVLSVSLGCSSDQCFPSSTVLCSMIANTNKVLGCYVGTYYEKGQENTFIKQICAPVASGLTAAYCKV